MTAETAHRKQFLFLDDDAAFLQQARDLFGQLSRGAWEMHLAQNHAQALALLRERRVDLVVLDLGMPVVDGAQFLRLLNRAHPGQAVVVLTGLADEARRRECLELGALMVFEKPTAPGGYESLYAALDALVAAPVGGFRGVMRSLGLEEVLQMECLGRKSSVLEIFTGRTRGRIFIEDGSIIHAEQGGLLGEVALYSLLALRGGEFNLRPFTPPPQRTIEGQWEFLLMEAARLRDEGGVAETAPEAAALPEVRPAAPAAAEAVRMTAEELSPASQPPPEVVVEEVVLCSGTGEVLFEWGCRSLEPSLALLGLVEEQARQLVSGLPVGRLERAVFHTSSGRVLCLVQSDRRLLVRNSGRET
jgi:CheY-like chemotaxis protein